MRLSGGQSLDSGSTESTPYNLAKGQIGTEPRHPLCCSAIRQRLE